MVGWTYLNALQLLLFASALGLIARRLYVLLFQAPLDTRAFLSALETALSAHQLDLARSLAEACAPAWSARLALAGLTELERGASPASALDEAHAELAHGLARGRDALVASGRIASPLAFIIVIVETGKALHGGEGLIGLQRGLALSVALQRSLLAFAIGLATSLVCFAAAGIVQRRALAISADLERVANAVARSAAMWGSV